MHSIIKQTSMYQLAFTTLMILPFPFCTTGAGMTEKQTQQHKNMIFIRMTLNFLMATDYQYYKLQVFCNKSRLFQKTPKFSSRDSSRFYKRKARIVSILREILPKTSNYPCKKLLRLFEKTPVLQKNCNL